MVFGQIAVLANAIGIFGSVVMLASGCGFLPPISMVTVFAHAFCIELPVDVRALSDFAPRASLNRLFRLLGLTRLSDLLRCLLSAASFLGKCKIGA